MTNKVFVVTGLDYGWDCIVGVFKNTTKEQLEKDYPTPDYGGHFMIFEQTVYNGFNPDND